LKEELESFVLCKRSELFFEKVFVFGNRRFGEVSCTAIVEEFFDRRFNLYRCRFLDERKERVRFKLSSRTFA